MNIFSKNLNINHKKTINGQIFNIENQIIKLQKTFIIKNNINNKIISLSCNFDKWDPNIKDYDFVACDFFENNIKAPKEIIKVVNIKLIKKFEDIEKKQLLKSRTLLNLKTKDSAFNSIIDLEILIKFCKRYNISNFSISNINTIDNIPKTIKLAKKNNLKFIPGLEINLIDDEKKVISFFKSENSTKIYQNNILNMLISDIEFVVIDLETNGINPYKDEIIEIGLAVIKNNYITSTAQWFLKYDNLSLKQSITDLTKITTLQLQKFGQKPKIVAQKLWEKINKKNIVLVSHSEFDIGFLNIFFKKYLNLSIYQPHIDSWFLSQKIFTKSKSFSVTKLCNYLNISIEGQAHRASDDAFNTAKILIEIIKNINIISFKDFDLFHKNKIYYHTFGNKVTLICKNNESLKILHYIMSLANCNFFKYTPNIPKSIIRKYKNYFYILSPAIGGQIANLFEKGILDIYYENFHDFYDYIEIMPEYSQLKILNNKWYLLQNKENNKKYNRLDIFNNTDIQNYYKILKKRNLKLIATDNARYIEKNDYEAFNVIHSYKRIFDGLIEDNKLYLRTYDEFLSSFPILKKTFQENIINKILLENAKNIANNINSDFNLVKKNFFLINNEETSKKFIIKINNKLRKKYKINHPIIKNRIKKELEIIIKNGFVSFFNLAEELALFSKKHNKIIGSRGSVGSSFIAYLLEITEVNALKPHYICLNCNKYIEFINDIKCRSGFDLPDKNCPKCDKIMYSDGHNLSSEMFFGLKGNKIPDIDINVDSTFQKECHNFFLKKYNANTNEKLSNIKVLRSSTKLKIQKKNSIFFINKFLEKNNSINLDHNMISFLLKNCQVAQGKHPGGLIFIPQNKSIFEYTSIISLKKDLLTQYEWHDLENYLLKLDILSHDDPLVLSYLLKNTNVSQKDIKFNDKQVLSLFNSYDFINIHEIHQNIEIINIFEQYKKYMQIGSLGVPEFGTIFSRKVLKKINPKNFNNLAQISGLTHGKNIWNNNSERLIRNKQKTIDDILSSRDDIIFFLTQNNIDFNLAFEITKFIKKGKTYTDNKKWLEYAKQLKAKGISDIMITHIGKISYLFPKSHAIAYAINAFKIAYFKIYYPLTFYASFLNRKIIDIDVEMFDYTIKKLFIKLITLNKNNTNYNFNYLDYLKITKKKTILSIILEMKFRNIKILKCDFFKSNPFTFKIENTTSGKELGLRIPLCIIKGIGSKNLQKIIKVRKKCVKLNDYETFKKITGLNDSIIELLIKNNVINNIHKNNQNTFF